MAEKPVYMDKDDGRHFFDTPWYYEWWYFDSHFDNGYTCAVGYHFPLGHARPRVPALYVCIFTPKGEDVSVLKGIDAARCMASSDKCDVKLGNHFAVQEGDTYRIKAMSGRAGADLVFKRKLPGWKPKASSYFYDNGSEKHGWLVPMPRAEVEGTIYIQGEPIKVKGLGYHDHNWGNVDMHDSLHSWFWGRLHHPNYTMIYYYHKPARQEDPDESMFYLAKGDRPVLVPDKFSLVSSGELRDDVYNKSMPRDIEIDASEGSTKFKCSIYGKGLSTRSEMLYAAPWPQYYWRLVAGYTAEVTVGGETDKIEGIPNSEYMLLR
jgi:hypothetical protein